MTCGGHTQQRPGVWHSAAQHTQHGAQAGGGGAAAGEAAAAGREERRPGCWMGEGQFLFFSAGSVVPRCSSLSFVFLVFVSLSGDSRRPLCSCLSS